MSTTNPDPIINNGGSSSSAPLAPAADIPTTESTPSSNGGQTTEEVKTSNNTQAVPPASSVAPADNATNAAPSSSPARQFFPRSGDSNWMKRDKLDLDALEKGARGTGTYSGALLMTAALVPVVAAVISAVAFVVQWPKGVAMPDWLALLIGTPLLLGTIPTLIAWFLLAFIVRRFAAADRMDMGSYGKLLNRLSTLDAQLSILCPEPGETSASATGANTNTTSTLLPNDVAFVMASKEALDCRNAISKKLVKKSLGWVTASGYINLWKEMHDAEEALIDILPREVMVADAIYDEMRIQDSKIDNSDELLRKLRLAVSTLDQSARSYLQPSQTSTQGASAIPSAAPASTATVSDVSEMQGRSILREVRQALNEFRDDRWEGIVRVRNQFVCTMILTGLILYVLLQFTILAGVAQAAMITATAFYLVGALVGLFGRLYNESQTSKSIDDYRLALARTVATPMFSGLAAVGGVLLTQKLTSLGDIFDPKNILSGLIVAAVFGLTPNLLIGVLQKQSEQYKTDLKSTAASQSEDVKTS
ncbi:MAG TPA: hypothetical protein VF043_18030 [Ktedonobacteraceae bacterium]